MDSGLASSQADSGIASSQDMDKPGTDCSQGSDPQALLLASQSSGLSTTTTMSTSSSFISLEREDFDSGLTHTDDTDERASSPDNVS